MTEHPSPSNGEVAALVFILVALVASLWLVSRWGHQTNARLDEIESKLAISDKH